MARPFEEKPSPDHRIGNLAGDEGWVLSATKDKYLGVEPVRKSEGHMGRRKRNVNGEGNIYKTNDKGVDPSAVASKERNDRN